MKLDGRGILITGGSQGLGKAIAKACLSEGAHVCLCARNSEALKEARVELASGLRNGQKLITFTADVSKPDEVTALIQSACRDLPSLDGLVNNAGIYGPKGLTDEVDWEEWVRAIEINVFGTLLMCRGVLPIFRKQRHGKIVNLSGGGATAPLPRFSAYAASKSAVVRLTETLCEENRDSAIDVNAIAPGALNTRLLDEVLDAGPEKVGQAFYDRMVDQKQKGGTPLEKGADLAVYLLSAASDGISGKLLSAVWDPWQSLADHREELDKSDIYTLRRIVPKDRGQDWG